MILGEASEIDMYKIHKEAMVMERLAHSPRVLDIYGFCGSSVHVEPMAGDLWKKIIPGNGEAFQKDLDRRGNKHLSQNALTPSEKLQISLDMAESLADLHGFEGGPITHADTHIEQWLLAPDGSIKLNDFNNAREPRWNANKGEYCESRGGYGGSVRILKQTWGGFFRHAADDYSNLSMP
jgi:serine/threonine protein kinase